MRRALTIVISLLLFAPLAAAQVINTIAGGGPNNVAATSVNLNIPRGMAFDSAGNLYVAVESGHRVFKVDTSGNLSVFAGVGIAAFGGDGGPAANASISGPFALAFDAAGNLFIADNFNHRIRRVDAVTGVITTVAGTGSSSFSGDGGRATNAGVVRPFAVAFDASGNLFVSDSFNRRVRRIVPGTDGLITGTADEIITTVVGNGVTCTPPTAACGDGGPATSANVVGVPGLVFDASGGLLMADAGLNRIRRVVPGADGVIGGAADEIITTVVGNGVTCNPTTAACGDGGPAASANLRSPQGVAFDSAGNLLVADTGDHRVRRVVPGADGLITGAADEIITTVAGNGVSCSPATAVCGDGGAATSANLNNPIAVAFDASGDLFISDTSTFRIRRVDAAGLNAGRIFTAAGNGFAGFCGDGALATDACLSVPHSVAFNTAGDLFIADANNARIRKVNGMTGTVSTVAGNGSFCVNGSSVCGDGGPAVNAGLLFPIGVAFDNFGNLFILDFNLFNVRRVDAVTGLITRVAGSGIRQGGFSGDGGPAVNALFNSPRAMVFDGSGALFIADQNNSRIRRIDPGADGKIMGAADEIITTVAGSVGFGFGGDGGPATNARLASPAGINFDSAGNLFVADQQNHRIRMIVPGADGRITGAADEIISTVAGNGVQGFLGDGGLATNARLNNPAWVSFDAAGNFYITDLSNQRIRRVEAVGGAITPASTIQTIAGSGTFGFAGDGGPATLARLGSPSGTLVDSVGRLLVADAGNHRIRRLDFPGNHPPVANAGPDQTIVVASTTGGLVTLNGSASMDPDGDGLSYTWTGSFGMAMGASPTVNLPMGISGITLTVQDGRGGISTDSVVFTLTNTVTTVNYTPNPGTYGQPSQMNVVVSSPLGTPTGTITATFSGFGGTTINLVNGQNTLFSVVFNLPLGGTLTVRYNGSGTFTPSTTVINTVVAKSDTQVTLTSSLNPSLTGQSVTFTARVNPVAPGGGVCGAHGGPMGSVQFKVDGVNLGSPVSLPTGPCVGVYSANISTTTLTQGTHTMTAEYPGDAKYNGSTGTLTQTVNSPDSTPPVITPNVTGTLGNNGWYTSDVNVAWTVEDAESAVSSQTGCGPSSVTADAAGVTFTCEASSLGGTASQSVTIKRDATPPTASASASPGPNANGWNNSDVTVTFTGNDNLSGIDTCSAPAVLSSEGMNQSASGTCTDLAGNTSDPATASGINIDKTAPAIATSRTPAANANGWNNTAVEVRFEASDALSGVEVPIEIVSLTLQGAGQSASRTFTDRAGNSASATVGGINIDLTPPEIAFTGQSPAANVNGWNNTNVTLHWSCSDALSGAAAPGTSQTLTAEGMNLSATGTCNDLAGNSASHTQGGVNIDKTPPSINIVAPANGASFLLNASVPASYDCNDALSGVAACAGPVANGANMDMSSVGFKTFTVNASDMAGNVASLTHNYTVQYSFVGFLQPVDNLPVINQAKPGRTVPVKWQLKDAGGNYVSDLGSMVSLLSAPMACDASPMAIVEEQLTSPGSTVFRYDATANQFILNWQSASSWKGCRLLQLTLADGSMIYAKFNFK